MDDGQKSPRGHSGFHSYMKIQCVFIFQTEVSCFSVTLLYSTLLALTHRQSHRRRNKYTRYAWLEEPFFPVVLLCQFSVLVGNRFWFYILFMYLEYHTVVVLCYFFLIWREIVFGTYILSVQYSCAVVSIFLLWRESKFSMNFLVESENFLLVFLALYGSTTIQSRLFLKKYQELCLIS